MDRGDLDRLLRLLAELDGSDLHIKAGAPPRVRVNGSLRTLDDEPRFTVDETAALAASIMDATLSAHFDEHHEADFAYSVAGVGRFRVNAYFQRSSVALAMRRVRTSASTIEDLGLPEVVNTLANEHRGLILVTGPTGSGKTTTLAAILDRINRTRACHVVTIEDPVEYLHRDELAAIDQREVGFDTENFFTAMRVVLRQDPDVILVGEMRDPETVYAALSAAETGHLVLSTLHTINATETINRIVDFFPPHQQGQIRVTLAGCLKGTICQRLVPRADGRGRVPAVEVMVTNGRIQQSILDPTLTGDIEELVAEGEFYGMQTFDQALVKMIADGRIDLKDAMDNATNQHDLKVLLESKGILKTGRAANPVASAWAAGAGARSAPPPPPGSPPPPPGAPSLGSPPPPPPPPRP